MKRERHEASRSPFSRVWIDSDGKWREREREEICVSKCSLGDGLCVSVSLES